MTPILLTTLNARYFHSSLGLGYLLANMGDLQADTGLREFIIDERPIDVAERLLREQPRIIGLSVYIWNVEQTTQLVALLKQNTRKSDQLFRYGGEEFVLLLPGVDGIGLKAVMNNLQQVLRKYMKHPGGSVTASFGVALLEHGESVDTWLARADAALYEAKETGRGRVVFADAQRTPELAAETA